MVKVTVFTQQVWSTPAEDALDMESSQLASEQPVLQSACGTLTAKSDCIHPLQYTLTASVY